MIALVFCGDLKYCPYIKRYLERLDLKKVEYKVYFWNRGGFELNLPENYIFFDSYSKLKKNHLSKLIDFLKFRRWLLKKLKQENPKKIIALSTLSALILGRFLYTKTKSYIFDIRDYSYEHIKFVYKMEEKIIKNSFFTAISSKGFKNFLPVHKYIIAHNFNRSELQEKPEFIPTDGKINFVWNGAMRYFSFQTQYLKALKNDERFQIIYHGDGPEFEEFKVFCKNNNIHNVVFTGSYNNADKAKLLQNAHILNNAYGHLKESVYDNIVKYAVSNRFYDGLNFHIPQVVEPTGYKREWVEKEKIGVSFFPDDFFADKLYNYYKSIDAEKFNDSCNRVLKEVVDEDDEYVKKIDEFVSG